MFTVSTRQKVLCLGKRCLSQEKTSNRTVILETDLNKGIFYLDSGISISSFTFVLELVIVSLGHIFLERKRRTQATTLEHRSVVKN